jgi:poly(A)-specific ribonuclease
MDVDKIAFPPRLLEILEALAECHFASIDFEFSGVSSKPAGRSKQTLQERYAETAEAASKYQILQVGLTCAKWDDKKSAYVLKPYNIPICATFDEDLDLERQFSFQSSAVEFLLKNNFAFNVSFEDGVPYLSREEEEQAKRKFKDRSKKEYDDIEVSDSDVLTQQFLDKVRGEIGEWQKKSREEGVEIVSLATRSQMHKVLTILKMSRTAHWKEKQETGGDLTGFDKRLIHQLIRNEFPELVSIGRRQSIFIKPMDEERELQVRKEKYKRFKKKIYAQTGFRWVIEAMAKGSLAKIDLMWFTRDPKTGAARYYEPDAYEARYHRVVDKLKRKSPVLVGHNCFTDLIYLYATFIGKLPDKVTEFQERIHDLFPCVVDTKYMFTHNCGNMNPASSLDSIEEGLRIQQIPKTKTHKAHGKYATDDMYHEAGYDSLLTAKVAILLSAKLEAQGTYVEDGRANNPAPGTPVKAAQATPPPVCKPGQQPARVVLPAQPRSTSRFATKTLFDALADQSEHEDQDGPPAIVGTSFALNPNARPFPIAAVPVDGTSESAASRGHSRVSSPSNLKNQKPAELKIDLVMPPWNADFWRVYSNKLRVFGTAEGLLDLDPSRMQ